MEKTKMPEIVLITLLFMNIFSTTNATTTSTTVATTVKTTNFTSELDIHGGIGLVQEVGIFQFKKAITNSLISVKYKVEPNFVGMANIIKEIAVLLVTVYNIPVLKDATYKSKIQDVFDIITSSLEQIEKGCKDLSKFIQTQVEIEPIHECLLEFSPINIAYLESFKGGIFKIISQMDKTITVASVTTDPKIFSRLSIELYELKDYISEYREDILQRLFTMDTLILGKIPEQLPFDLEMLSCLQPGEQERMTINYCKEYTDGLFCEIAVNSFNTLQQYHKYVPVNYNGVQLKLNDPNQVLLKTNLGTWELLSCYPEIEDDYDTDYLSDIDECKIIPYHNPCTDNLFSTNFDKLLAECNFTSHIEPQKITRTPTGFLFMGNDFIVKETPRNNKKGIQTQFPQKYPLHVTTNDLLKVKIDEKEITLKPYYLKGSRKIHYTYLSDEFLSKMSKKAYYSDILEDMEVDHYIYIVFGILLAILLPITLCLCCKQIQVSDLYQRWQNNRARKIIRNMRKTRNNFSANKRFFQQAPREPDHE